MKFRRKQNLSTTLSPTNWKIITQMIKTHYRQMALMGCQDSEPPQVTIPLQRYKQEFL